MNCNSNLGGKRLRGMLIELKRDLAWKKLLGIIIIITQDWILIICLLIITVILHCYEENQEWQQNKNDSHDIRGLNATMYYTFSGFY